jgi:hypothetical protein
MRGGVPAAGRLKPATIPAELTEMRANDGALRKPQMREGTIIP